jgi:hypothetical protein
VQRVSARWYLSWNVDIPVIIDYCGEGFVDEECVEAELDLNAEMFRLTA